METSSRTRIKTFEATHSWTIENWKQWTKISTAQVGSRSVLYSKKFSVPFVDKNGEHQTTTWQVKAFPDKDRKGRNTLKLKLVSHNLGTDSVPPGMYNVKSEPLFSFYKFVWFGFHWSVRHIDHLKSQFPVPYHWPKKHLKIEITIKLFVPVNLRKPYSVAEKKHTDRNDSVITIDSGVDNLSDSLNEIPGLTSNIALETGHKTPTSSAQRKEKSVEEDDSNLRIEKSKNKFGEPVLGNNSGNATCASDQLTNVFATAPSLMEPF